MKELNHPNPKLSATPNPIEEAIGERAKDPKAQEKFTKEFQSEPIPQPLEPAQIPEEPSPSEMQTLEELNRQTEERLRDDPILDEKLTQEERRILNHAQIVTGKKIPASKPGPQPATKTSSEESPPQKIEEIDEYSDAEKRPSMAELLGQKTNEVAKAPVEDIELTALKKYIREDGFVLATVAFHIVTLCAQPMVTPSTTNWDFKDRASIPDMVLALLNQPGYLEGIWPSLKIVMSSNKGNAAWCAGIATTIAFFDVVRTLPAVKELSNEEKS